MSLSKHYQELNSLTGRGDNQMNEVAIAIKLNDRRFFVGARWPTMRTLAYRLKRNIRDIAHNMAMAFIPLPSVAIA